MTRGRQKPPRHAKAVLSLTVDRNVYERWLKDSRDLYELEIEYGNFDYPDDVRGNREKEREWFTRKVMTRAGILASVKKIRGTHLEMLEELTLTVEGKYRVVRPFLLAFRREPNTETYVPIAKVDKVEVRPVNSDSVQILLYLTLSLRNIEFYRRELPEAYREFFSLCRVVGLTDPH